MAAETLRRLCLQFRENDAFPPTPKIPNISLAKSAQQYL